MKTFWTDTLSAELAPFTGRMAGSLRTALAASIAVSILLGMQMPAIGNGLFMLLLVSYEQPRLTLFTGMREVLMQFAGVIAALVLVEVSGNDPMARVLGVAVFIFASSFVARAGRAPALGMPFSVFSVITLSNWELHLPEKQIIEMSLWPVASAAVAVGCAVAVEHLLHVRDPIARLRQEIDQRLEAVERVLRLYAEGADAARLQPAVRAVTRWAFAGQAKMQLLAGEAADSDAPMVIPMYARLVDLVAAIGHKSLDFDEGDRARFGRAAEICARLRARQPLQPGTAERSRGGEQMRLLDQMEETLDEIITIPEVEPAERQPYRPEQAVSGWLADAFTNSEYLYFSLRITLCATFCYVLCISLHWPGIATAVPTVVITGLDTTGAIKQKQFFRLAGSALGGLVLGIGAVMYLFPYLDSVAPLVVVVAAVMFASAWIARGPHLGYVGMQMGLSFCLVALSSLGTPTDLSPARDRVVGVGLALVVMWLIVDRAYGVRTTAAMRDTLVRLLRSIAKLLRANASASGRQAVIARSVALRTLIANEISSLRKLAEVVPYEFGTDRERELQLSDKMLEVTLGAANLALNVFAMLHDEEYAGAADDEVLKQLHRNLAAQIELAALAIERNSAGGIARLCPAEDLASRLDQLRHEEHARNVVARYGEFRTILPAVFV